ncbi:DNA polymerase III subunit beta [Salipiger bermudensis]|uniref:DNA polymerase III subunit beta n=1 Tax=Salipiger bermudensis TaxID=344736 RepID=UPI001CD5A98A|nr:DNA polymerase III subunit beta [Salipiger bermudensis]MCA0963310.1 DNA polymerase III subunit beta [Salipiger bermudensis]
MLHHRKEMTATKASATIQIDALKRATRILNKVVELRNTIPVLSYVKITIASNRVTLEATDLDNALTMELEAETTGDATFMVGKSVLAGLTSIASGAITVSITANDPRRGVSSADTIILTDGETLIRLNVHMPVEDFPRLEAPESLQRGTAHLSLSQDQVERLLSLSRHCVSTELTRYYLTGIYLTNRPEEISLRAVSTDGHRMAVIDSEAEVDFSSTGSPGLIVATKTADLLSLIIEKGCNEPVTFRFAKTFLSAEVAGVSLRAKTIDGTYPDYTRVIPPQSKALVAHLSGSALRRMHKAAKAMNNNYRPVAEMNFEEGKISARGPSITDGTSITMPLQASREEGCTHQCAGFNLNYLRDQGAVTPTFTLATMSPGDPATIQSDDPDALWVIMPMRL